MNSKKTNKAKKIILIVLAVILVLIICAGLYLYSLARRWAGLGKPGNSAKYDIENVETLKESPLAGKRVMFLGSSVTLGMASQNTSFVEYMEKRDQIVVVAKEAVSGTTLVYNGENSYIERMENNLDKSANVDLFICQLSTNDASQEMPLGEVSASMNKADFDTSTVTGSIEYIIAYAKESWDCDVVFYTGSWFNSAAYDAMVDNLLEVQEKWDIGVINMWDDEVFNNIDDETREFYMNDDVHPVKAGYLEWWTPYMEEYLYKYVQ